MTIHYEDAHATVWHGDCVTVLAGMPDNTFDAVITDPPYGLEFMGKDWDRFSDVPRSTMPRGTGGSLVGDKATPQGRTGVSPNRGNRTFRCRHCRGWSGQFSEARAKRQAACQCDSPDFDYAGAPAQSVAFQAWCETWAAECLRVLKPGGHLVAFGGTRTWHRLVCAIEDAGFEVRDSVAWLYGCLSDDTEILTSDGWVRYDRATTEHHALAFDTRTGTLEWQQVQHVHRYWHDGEMVRLSSEHTDQLVTPNHRVIIEAGQATAIPYVSSREDLRSLLAAIPGPRPLPMGAEEDLLEGVREHVSVGAPTPDGEAAGSTRWPSSGMRDLRDRGLATQLLDQDESGNLLFSEMQRRAARAGMEGARAQGTSGQDARELRERREEDDRPEQPSVEGRRYRVQEARELCRGAVRAGAGVGTADGPQGRLHHGAPSTDGRDVRLPDDTAGSRQPREPRPDGQQARESDALAVEPGSQDVRVGPDGGRRVLPPTRVQASIVGYAGVVWCITVPHGAFIARRNGLIFATGNSGFPKSLDVSKAIDKAAGAERTEPAGVKPGHEKFVGRDNMKALRESGALSGEGGFSRPWMHDPEKIEAAHHVMAPATAEAQRWAGYGTALKPGHEPVCVARKPLDGTVAANVLKWGTGAVNIDAMRIEAGQDRRMCGTSEKDGQIIGFGARSETHSSAGRWPANVILDEATAAALDQQTGEQRDGVAVRRNGVRGGEIGPPGAKAIGTPDQGYGGSGGASRYFYTAKAPADERVTIDGVSHVTVKPLDLMRWLVRGYGGPKGALILDPFAGSGTTGEAAIAEGMRAVLIEQDETYLPLIKARATRRTDPVEHLRTVGGDLGLFGLDG